MPFFNWPLTSNLESTPVGIGRPVRAKAHLLTRTYTPPHEPSMLETCTHQTSHQRGSQSLFSFLALSKHVACLFFFSSVPLPFTSFLSFSSSPSLSPLSAPLFRSSSSLVGGIQAHAHSWRRCFDDPGTHTAGFRARQHTHTYAPHKSLWKYSWAPRQCCTPTQSHTSTGRSRMETVALSFLLQLELYDIISFWVKESPIVTYWVTETKTNYARHLLNIRWCTSSLLLPQAMAVLQWTSLANEAVVETLFSPNWKHEQTLGDGRLLIGQWCQDRCGMLVQDMNQQKWHPSHLRLFILAVVLSCWNAIPGGSKNLLNWRSCLNLGYSLQSPSDLKISCVSSSCLPAWCKQLPRAASQHQYLSGTSHCVAVTVKVSSVTRRAARSLHVFVPLPVFNSN